MPYSKNSKLPQNIASVLPEQAQTIFRITYNNAYRYYKNPKNRRGDDSRDDTARKVAWTAVEMKYKKEDGDTKWSPK